MCKNNFTNENEFDFAEYPHDPKHPENRGCGSEPWSDAEISMLSILFR